MDPSFNWAIDWVDVIAREMMLLRWSSPTIVDRMDRAEVRHVTAAGSDTAKFDDAKGTFTRVTVGESAHGWADYADTFTGPDQPVEHTQPPHQMTDRAQNRRLGGRAYRIRRDRVLWCGACPLLSRRRLPGRGVVSDARSGEARSRQKRRDRCRAHRPLRPQRRHRTAPRSASGHRNPRRTAGADQCP